MIPAMSVEIKNPAWSFCVVTLTARLEDDRVDIICSCGTDMSFETGGDSVLALNKALKLVENHLPPLAGEGRFDADIK